MEEAAFTAYITVLLALLACSAFSRLPRRP